MVILQQLAFLNTPLYSYYSVKVVDSLYNTHLAALLNIDFWKESLLIISNAKWRGMPKIV